MSKLLNLLENFVLVRKLKTNLEMKQVSRKRAEKLISKLQKTTLKRPEIRQSLQWLISTSLQRLSNKWTKNKERLAWARVLVQASNAATVLLRDQDLEELEERIFELEKQADQRGQVK